MVVFINSALRRPYGGKREEHTLTTQDEGAIRKKQGSPGKCKGARRPLFRSRVRRCLGGRLAVLVNQKWLRGAFDHALVDDHLADVLLGRNLVHGIEHHPSQNRAQAASTCLARQRTPSYRLERIRTELQIDPFELEQLGVLLGQRILRLGKNLDECGFIQLVQRRDDRQAADELGNQTELDQIVRLHYPQGFADLLAQILAANLGIEADATLGGTSLDDFLQARERTATDEQDIARIDLQELLLRMLAPTLRRNRCNSTLDQLEQCLLHALARHVARDRRVVGLA